MSVHPSGKGLTALGSLQFGKAFVNHFKRSFPVAAMTLPKIETILQAAFAECDAAFCALTQKQKQILLRVILEEMTQRRVSDQMTIEEDDETDNPLDDLTPDQRISLLEFVREQEKQDRLWKIQLLNDWLENRDSGAVQFIRDRHGPQWLNRIQPVHLAEYYEKEGETGLQLKVGDRIEVANNLWEWVQETGPCTREWFPCTIVEIYETQSEEDSQTNCMIRFPNGTEYEIQGIYQWNRYNWRWLKA